MTREKGQHAARCACFMVLLQGAALCQDESAADASEAAEDAEGPEAAAEGLLPVPDYSGGWTKRPFLSGDWGGRRQDWANKGVTFDFEWFQVAQGVLSGGLDERARTWRSRARWPTHCACFKRPTST